MAKTGNTFGFSIRRLAFCKKGQLLLPAVILLPLMWVFVMLLLETAKLSRAKIKHQLAVDVASTIEMENYSDYFNRTAYVNGAFPYRIFAEQYEPGGMWINSTDHGRPGGVSINPKDMMLANGLYPTWAPSQPSSADNLTPVSLSVPQGGADTTRIWPLFYTGVHGIRANGEGKSDNTCPNDSVDWNLFSVKLSDSGHFYFFRRHNCLMGAAPPMDQCDYTPGRDQSLVDRPCGGYDMDHIAMKQTQHDIYFKFWYQAYTLLGQVSNTQASVYTTLTKEHQFFKKAYYLNTGECAEGDSDEVCGTGIASLADANGAKVTAFEPQLVGDPFVSWFSDFSTDPVAGTPINVVPYIMRYPTGFNLFQFRRPSVPDIEKLNALGSTGIGVQQTWKVENNFFNIDLNSEERKVGNVVYVRSSACTTTYGCDDKAANGLYGGYSVTNGSNNTIWPAPTPKYLVVLDP